MGVRRWTGIAAVPLLVMAGVGPAAPAPQRPESGPEPGPPSTITVYGRPGTFGALEARIPTGQGLTGVGVPEWGLPTGWQADASAVARDGTVLVAGRPATAPGSPAAAPGPVIGVFSPATGRHSTLLLDGVDGRSTVTDLEPVGDAVAVMFTPGPRLGVLTTAGGRWRLAPAPEVLTAACPSGRCAGPADVTALPGTRDLVVASSGDAGGNGSLIGLRLIGPDRAGRFTFRVQAGYTYPAVPDPATGDRHRLRVSPVEVRADPTSRGGRWRLAVGLTVSDAKGRRPRVLQEFSYDSRAIEPLSAPLLPGDRLTDLWRRPVDFLWPFGTSAYDGRGNLWVARTDGLRGGTLAVYAAPAAGAPVGGCVYRPGRRLDSYVSRAGDTVEWGQTCRPDYGILQASETRAMEGIAVDPVTGDVMALALGGYVLPIRVSGAGKALRFRVGGLVDVGLKLLPAEPGVLRREWLAGIGPDHRLWLVSSYFPGAPGRDHWLFAVAPDDLFDPASVDLADTPGRMVAVQAERTLTTGTVQRPGSVTARIVVDSEAYVAECQTWMSTNECGHDDEPGDGVFVRDDSGFGHLTGELAYRVRVPVEGRYRLVYRVFTFPKVSRARIKLSVAGQTVTTPIASLGRWGQVYEDRPLDLPAGVHTVRLAPPPGGGGWALSWFGLQRM